VMLRQRFSAPCRQHKRDSSGNDVRLITVEAFCSAALAL
jgi:hypothetical protein